MEMLCNGPDHGLPCAMADGRNALLIRNPTIHSASRDFGFQVPGEKNIRWRPAERIVHLGGGALAEAQNV
jgi:hypothetical protein